MREIMLGNSSADHQEKIRDIAFRVFESSRYQIYFKLRYMEHALFYLIPEERGDITTGSDGKKYYYGNVYLMNRYLQSPDASACDYLHTALHCLYQHPLQAKNYEKRYWDLAADIAVTDVVGEMQIAQFQQEVPGVCFAIIQQLKKEVTLMSAHKIMQYLISKEFELKKIYGMDIEEMAEFFRRDEHTCWYSFGRTEKKNNRNTMSDVSSNEGTQTVPDALSNLDDKPDMMNGHAPQNSSEYRRSGTKNTHEPQNFSEYCRSGTENAHEPQNSSEYRRSGTENAPVPQSLSENRMDHTETNTLAEILRQLEDDWKDIAEKVMLSAQSFSFGKERGELPGNMTQILQRLTRESYDYTEFLKKFAVLEENMKLNLDEFDYLFYLYGFNKLAKIALVEPLEYKEEYRIWDFVIAIDTSGSCSGDLVQRFLNKTYNILKSTESFSQKVRIHIIQCDSVIQEDFLIEDLEELEQYTENMVIKGLGGTDFRPVFEYVGQLCQENAFRDLQGLIYFTDGYGVFPNKPPGYKTAFVFVDRDDVVRVPPWAMKIYFEDMESRL
ncbi:MAG: VWA-like domain-containing protein [Clostridiales bacterium]|nr:VWA-like domain-containing protein [Clostridiales bacterium]